MIYLVWKPHCPVGARCPPLVRYSGTAPGTLSVPLLGFCLRVVCRDAAPAIAKMSRVSARLARVPLAALAEPTM